MGRGSRTISFHLGYPVSDLACLCGARCIKHLSKTKMKTTIYKTDSSWQYVRGSIALCITRRTWRTDHGIPVNYGGTLFYGSAYGPVSREFSADILRQFRREQRRSLSQ